ncbi:hypothetical protein C2G38_2115561, partial [Gigaspora rosea]
VSVTRIRRNDGTKRMIDPSLYKNNLQKFSDITIDVKPRPLDHSTSEIVMTSKSKNLLVIFGVKNNQNISYVENERNAEGQNANILSPDKLPQSIIDVRLEAIKQRALDKKAEKVKITQTSQRIILFSDNDLAQEVSDNFNLFDSDEEYNNNEKPTLDIAINPIFEDESG